MGSHDLHVGRAAPTHFWACRRGMRLRSERQQDNLSVTGAGLCAWESEQVCQQQAAVERGPAEQQVHCRPSNPADGSHRMGQREDACAVVHAQRAGRACVRPQLCRVLTSANDCCDAVSCPCSPLHSQCCCQRPTSASASHLPVHLLPVLGRPGSTGNARSSTPPLSAVELSSPRRNAISPRSVCEILSLRFPDVYCLMPVL